MKLQLQSLGKSQDIFAAAATDSKIVVNAESTDDVVATAPFLLFGKSPYLAALCFVRIERAALNAGPRRL